MGEMPYPTGLQVDAYQCVTNIQGSARQVRHISRALASAVNVNLETLVGS